MADHVLVTSGASYIGSHACKALKASGYVPVTFDNLSTGWREALKFGPFEEGCLTDRARLDEVFPRLKPVAVMHFAALSLVGESMKDPGKYRRGNVLAALNLIEAACEAECLDFIFTSTCATYGDQDGVILDETTLQAPINAYGAPERAIDDMLADFTGSHGLRDVIFRYFNLAGADPEAEVGEFHQPETHLIPLMLNALDGKPPALTICGIDYPTPDGTCIRDYVHACHLTDAHVLGLEWLRAGKASSVFCLGSGKGFSVREVIDQSVAVTNRGLPITEGARWPGDAAVLVSGSNRAERDLGWRPKRSDLRTMIVDASRLQQAGGYNIQMRQAVFRRNAANIDGNGSKVNAASKDGLETIF